MYKVMLDASEGTFEEFEDLMEWLESTDESFDKFELKLTKEPDVVKQEVTAPEIPDEG